VDFGNTEALITKLMGKGEAAARRELARRHAHERAQHARVLAQRHVR
jgi:hypothetical protein